jgi:hypothetical protein
MSATDKIIRSSSEKPALKWEIWNNTRQNFRGGEWHFQVGLFHQKQSNAEFLLTGKRGCLVNTKIWHTYYVLAAIGRGTPVGRDCSFDVVTCRALMFYEVTIVTIIATPRHSYWGGGGGAVACCGFIRSCRVNSNWEPLCSVVSPAIVLSRNSDEFLEN